ncbi:hypothetical protein RRG08_013954 [Elysia crispata]|uniref:Uncharacterized protein n=1 Tax=Elysia crispata TaxID=231223 RepID=A0AAE0ZYL3_9GAST|nr:hypothetical protein RRG08_013954 [Elysia crispata]
MGYCTVQRIRASYFTHVQWHIPLFSVSGPAILPTFNMILHWSAYQGQLFYLRPTEYCTVQRIKASYFTHVQWDIALFSVSRPTILPTPNGILHCSAYQGELFYPRPTGYCIGQRFQTHVL